MLGRVCKVLGFQKSYFDDGKKHWAAGTTVPTDGAAGYARGCFFIDTDASAGSVVYVNEGSDTSCDFNVIV